MYHKFNIRRVLFNVQRQFDLFSPTSDITKCRQGGFVYTSAGLEGQLNILALQNPAGQVAVAVLEVILTYAKTLNDFWSPASVAKLSPESKKALDLLESEKKTLIGISLAQRSSSVGPNEENGNGSEDKYEASAANSSNPLPVVKSEVQRLQTFIFEQFENVYHFLSQCFVSYGYEIYRQPNLAEAISSTVLQVKQAQSVEVVKRLNFFLIVASTGM